MSRVVQKFGGSSLADLACMRRAAQLVAQRWHQGEQVAVVVSAMGERTDHLLALAFGSLEISRSRQRRDRRAAGDGRAGIGSLDGALPAKYRTESALLRRLADPRGNLRAARQRARATNCNDNPAGNIAAKSGRRLYGLPRHDGRRQAHSDARSRGL